MSNDVQLLIENWGTPHCSASKNSDINTNIRIDESSNGVKGTYISGIFMQAEKVNGNGRIYPKAVLEHAVNEYINTQVDTNQALGELNHPSRSTPDPREAAIIIEELWFEGNNVMGRARVLDTPNGKIVKSLIEGGWIPGVSSRGLGRVKTVNGINEVQEGFKLTVGVDVVHQPSAPDAYVEGYTVDTDGTVNQMVSPSKMKTESIVKEQKTFNTKNIDVVSFTERMKTLI
jgi:hypothetical protein